MFKLRGNFFKRNETEGKRETSLFPVNVLFNYSNNNRHHRSNNNHHNDKNNNDNGSARSHVPCRAVSYASAIIFLRGSTWSCYA